LLTTIKRKEFFGVEKNVGVKIGKKGLIRNIASLSVVQIANYVLPLLSVPIISRIIGPDKLGVINFAASFVAYFTLLIGFGFDLSATRKIAADPTNKENRNIVFSEVLYCQLLLFSVSLVAFIICLLNVPQLKVETTVTVFSFLICVSTIFTQNWLFQAMQDLPKVALLNFASKLLFTVLILLVVKEKQDYKWYPLVFNGINILIAVLSFSWAVRRYQIKLIRIPFKACLKLLWNEKTIFLSLIVISVYTTTNVVILGLYHDATQVAYFTSAQRLIAIVQSLLTLPLYQAFYPYIGKAFGETKEKGMQIVQKLVPLILVFTGIACLAIFFLGPWFLVLFYGNKFAPATAVIRILAFLPMIICISNVYGIQVMLNLKMDKYFFYITGAGAVLSVVLNIIFLPTFGYIGSAYNCLLTELFINISMYFVLRYKGLNPLNRKYFKVLAFREFAKPFSDKLLRR